MSSFHISLCSFFCAILFSNVILALCVDEFLFIVVGSIMMLYDFPAHLLVIIRFEIITYFDIKNAILMSKNWFP
jgi:hypothetical protein